jgi:hypothetical protein
VKAGLDVFFLVEFGINDTARSNAKHRLSGYAVVRRCGSVLNGRQCYCPEGDRYLYGIFNFPAEPRNFNRYLAY